MCVHPCVHKAGIQGLGYPQACEEAHSQGIVGIGIRKEGGRAAHLYNTHIVQTSYAVVDTHKQHFTALIN